MYGPFDEDRARTAYEDLGPLTADDLAYLDLQPSDLERRRVLSNWYGVHGGAYAAVRFTEATGRVLVRKPSGRAT